MIQNYLTNFLFTFIGVCTLVAPIPLRSQELKIFTLKDFDLKGTVKSCLVITDYGKEEFDFNEAGFLTKSVTRYNDSDYDITYYKYSNGDVIEKRLENYRDNVFDKSTSIANIYEIDTTANKKILEKIYSYNEDFLDQYEYQYDSEGKLIKIRRTNNDGIDETHIEYVTYKGETTKTYFLNEVIQQSVRDSKRKTRNKGVQRIHLTKKFLEGQPDKAIEKIYSANDKLIKEQRFVYDGKEKSFVIQSVITNTYNDKGMLSKVKTKTGDLEETKEYIYQYDNGEEGNWIKQIITPENAYTTRKITYYEVEEAEKQK
ncbi:MAG: hypothetical protein WBG90_18945 [Saonia sp.]